jgi:hypothetical protein
VGVSNTAGTLNFINNMNPNKYILWCSCCIAIFIGIVSILIVIHIEHQVTSSPVEEMYHKQLVITLDSILDARFGTGCCEEDIDTVNANTFSTCGDDMISPVE